MSVAQPTPNNSVPHVELAPGDEQRFVTATTTAEGLPPLGFIIDTQCEPNYTVFKIGPDAESNQPNPDSSAPEEVSIDIRRSTPQELGLEVVTTDMMIPRLIRRGAVMLDQQRSPENGSGKLSTNNENGSKHPKRTPKSRLIAAGAAVIAGVTSLTSAPAQAENWSGTSETGVQCWINGQPGVEPKPTDDTDVAGRMWKQYRKITGFTKKESKHIHEEFLTFARDVERTVGRITEKTSGCTSTATNAQAAAPQSTAPSPSTAPTAPPAPKASPEYAQSDSKPSGPEQVQYTGTDGGLILVQLNLPDGTYSCSIAGSERGNTLNANGKYDIVRIAAASSAEINAFIQDKGHKLRGNRHRHTVQDAVKANAEHYSYQRGNFLCVPGVGITPHDAEDLERLNNPSALKKAIDFGMNTPENVIVGGPPVFADAMTERFRGCAVNADVCMDSMNGFIWEK